MKDSFSVWLFKDLTQNAIINELYFKCISMQNENTVSKSSTYQLIYSLDIALGSRWIRELCREQK